MHWNDGVWCWWSIAQCTVGSLGVVMLLTVLDPDLGLAQTVEDFASEPFSKNPRGEAFAISVLPR